jgi:hypothetical protein
MAWRGDAFEVRYQLYVELPQDLHDELQQLDRLLTPDPKHADGTRLMKRLMKRVRSCDGMCGGVGV